MESSIQFRWSIQGSNLALANLLNAVVFPKKQVEITITCYFLQVNASHPFQIMQRRINCLKNSVDPDQSASEEAD